MSKFKPVKKIPALINCLVFLFLFSSCKTYYISPESFRQQFEGIDSFKFIRAIVTDPAGMRFSYIANPIQIIHCTDKNNQSVEIENSPRIEIRFTGKNNKKITFYFDTIYVTDSSVTGVRSRFIPSFRKTISLNEVTKIEVQDDLKKYHYVK